MDFNEEDARAFYRWLEHRKGEFTEIRIIPWPSGAVIQRWVQSEDEFVKVCKKYSGKDQVYVGLNPRKRQSGSKEDVARVVGIPFDVDAKHPKNAAATEEELADAKKRMIEIVSWMRMQGFQQPFVSMSGNGFHIIQKVDLPIDERLTSRLESYFHTVVPEGDLDSIFDLPRIIKVPGTLSIKGEPTKDRPHRLSYIVNVGNKNVDNSLSQHIQKLEPYTEPISARDNSTTLIQKMKKLRTGSLKPCFKRFAEEGGVLSKVRSDDHLLRLALVIEAHKKNYSRDQIIDLFRKADDFNLKITTDKVNRQLSEIAVKGMRPWSCSAIHKHHGCIGESCSIYSNFIKTQEIQANTCPSCKHYFTAKCPIIEGCNTQEAKKIYEIRTTPCRKFKVKKVGKTPKDDKPDMGYVVDQLTAKYIFKCPTDTEKLLGYQDGVFIPFKWIIKDELECIYGTKINSAYIEEVIAHIKRANYCQRSEINVFRGKLPLINGVYNFETKTLEPFNPEEIYTFKTNIVYNPKAKSPIFLKFVKQILPKDDIPVLQEIMGYCFYPDIPFHFVFWFYGGGRNGKTRVVLTLQHMLNKETNCSGLNLNDLRGSRGFSQVQLCGKLLNISSEPDSKYPLQMNVLKMATGEDWIWAEVKGSNERVCFMNIAKFIIPGNNYPKIEDDSDGCWERIKILKFPYQFLGADIIPKIEQTWLTKTEEVSGIFNWALEGLYRLIKNKVLSISEGTEEIKAEFMKISDPFKAWLMTNCGFLAVGKIEKQKAFLNYKDFCYNIGAENDPANTFFRKLRDTPRVQEKQVRMPDGKKPRYFVGIFLKNLDVETPQQSLVSVPAVPSVTTPHTATTRNKNNKNNIIREESKSIGTAVTAGTKKPSEGEQSLNELIENVIPSKPTTLPEKAKIVLRLILAGEGTTGMIKRTHLIRRLNDDYGISVVDADIILYDLAVAEKIWTPVSGFLKGVEKK